jgi:hypothetical protein
VPQARPVPAAALGPAAVQNLGAVATGPVGGGRLSPRAPARRPARCPKAKCSGARRRPSKRVQASAVPPRPRAPPRAPSRRAAAPRRAQPAHGRPPPPPLPYKVDTSRPFLRTNWTRLRARQSTPLCTWATAASTSRPAPPAPAPRAPASAPTRARLPPHPRLRPRPRRSLPPVQAIMIANPHLPYFRYDPYSKVTPDTTPDTTLTPRCRAPARASCGFLPQLPLCTSHREEVPV